MDVIMKKLEKVLVPLAELIGKDKYLIAIRDGFLISTPLLIIGSFFLLIANFPIPGWDAFFAKFLGEGWANKFAVPASCTFDVMTILAVIGIGYSLAKQVNVDAIQASAIGLVSFLIITPSKIDFTPEGVDTVYKVTGIPYAWVGSKGLFLGMIVAIVSVLIFEKISKKGWVIKLPAGVPPTVAKSFEALIPGFVVITVFFIINWGFSLTSFGNAHAFIFKILQVPLVKLGNTLPAMVIAYLFLHGFWFFGINGGSVVGAVFNPVLRTLSIENLDAFKNGMASPNIICQEFQDLFATFGGAGSTLSLLIVMLIICKSQRVKKIGELALLPGIFGINEPIVFGLPIMLNPIMLIPFVIVPTVNIIITYFAMSSGIVPLTKGISVPWTTPPIISGFLVSGWQASVLQVLLLIIGAFIYAPFIKIVDKQYLEEEKAATETDKDDDLNFDDLEL